MRSVHDAYLEVGVDAIETNTFGANLANLGEYDIPDRIFELAEAGARIAREAADHWTTTERPRFVLGSMGPGTKLPSLGHAPYAALRDAYAEQARGLLAGAPTPSSSRPPRTCSRPRPRSSAASGPRRGG